MQHATRNKHPPPPHAAVYAPQVATGGDELVERFGGFVGAKIRRPGTGVGDVAAAGRQGLAHSGVPRRVVLLVATAVDLDVVHVPAGERLSVHRLVGGGRRVPGARGGGLSGVHAKPDVLGMHVLCQGAESRGEAGGVRHQPPVNSGRVFLHPAVVNLTDGEDVVVRVESAHTVSRCCARRTWTPS